MAARAAPGSRLHPPPCRRLSGRRRRATAKSAAVATAAAGRPRAKRLLVAAGARANRGTAWLLAAALVAHVVSAAVYLLTPAAFGAVLDAASASPADLSGSAARLAALYAAQALCAFLQAFLLTSATERLALDLRSRAFENAMRLDAAFFDANPVGEVLSRLSADVAQVRGALEGSFRAVRALVEMIGSLALLACTSASLTAVTLAVAPVAAALSKGFGAPVKKLSKEAQDCLAESLAVAEEALGVVRVAKSFTREGSHAERYSAAAGAAYALARRIAVRQGVLEGLVRSCGNASALVILVCGGALVARGELTVGALTSFVIYTLYVSGALGTLASAYGDVMKAEGAGSRLFELIDRAPERAGGRAPPGRWDMRLEGVTFAYPSRPGKVLDRVSMDFPEGEVTALVGPSGSGKSTVLALLQRLYEPDEGAVLIGGEDAAGLDVHAVRRGVAVVSQEPALMSGTVAENIAYGRADGDATAEEVEEAAEAANAAQFVRGFPLGFDTPLGGRGQTLSGGQRQRIAIARAVLKDAPVLLLDEATSALDASAESAVREALARLGAGRTVVVVAHRLQTVRDAHRVVVLDAGRVVEQGDYAELARRPGGAFARMLSEGGLAQKPTP